MAITTAQRESTRKSTRLVEALLNEAKASGMSGIPQVEVTISGEGKSARFRAQYKHQESTNTWRTYDIADGIGKPKVYAKLSDVVADVVAVAGVQIRLLPPSASFALTLTNPETIVPSPSTIPETVASLTKKLTTLRQAKSKEVTRSAIKEVEITGNAAFVTGTPEQRARYADMVSRKLVVDQLIEVMNDQDAEYVTLITRMGGTPPTA